MTRSDVWGYFIYNKPFKAQLLILLCSSWLLLLTCDLFVIVICGITFLLFNKPIFHVRPGSPKKFRQSKPFIYVGARCFFQARSSSCCPTNYIKALKRLHGKVKLAVEMPMPSVHWLYWLCVRKGLQPVESMVQQSPVICMLEAVKVHVCVLGCVHVCVIYFCCHWQ